MPVVISIANELNVMFQSNLRPVKTCRFVSKYVSIIVAIFVSNVNLLFTNPEIEKILTHYGSIPFSSTENRVLKRTRFLL